MSAPTGRYRRRGFNHLQTIRRTLQNLKGSGALANELIQNADDATNAHHLTFRFTADALEVIDDGGFDACDDLSSDTCAWERRRRPKAKLRCDFHAFQEIAGASKDVDPDLTGAFGVGFLSVYQVTDRPELLSCGEHWCIDESKAEHERIYECPGGCGFEHRTEGTLFRLPWAAFPSDMRTQLGAEPVPRAAQRQLYEAFCKAVPEAMIFLHKLKRVTVERAGTKPCVFERDPGDHEVRVTGPGTDELWLILTDDFDAEAAALRRAHPTIGARRSRVRVAVRRIKPQRRGLLSATLPTQVGTGLPVHVDASFFPKIDRKGILLEKEEGEWNRAAIECSATLVAANLEYLAHQLGHKPFWRLVHAAYENRDRERRGAGDSFGVFWNAIAAELEAAEVMWTTRGEWAAVGSTILPAPKHSDELLELYEAIGVNLVAQDIQHVVRGMGGGVPAARMTLARLLDALEDADLNEGPFEPSALPAGLSSRRRRNLLIRTLADFDGIGHDKERIRALALWRTSDRTYDNLANSYLVRRDTLQLFAAAISYPKIDEEAQELFAAPLLEFGDRWDVEEGVDELVANPPGQNAESTLRWLDTRRELLTMEQLTRLRDVALLPTNRGLRPAALSVIPGGFTDPLDIAGEVEPAVVLRHRELLTRLRVSALSIADYIREFIPKALEGRPTIAQLLALLDVLVSQRGALDEQPQLKRQLAGALWVPCKDAKRRAPTSVYFDTEVVREVLADSAPLVHESVSIDTAAADLLAALGAQVEPRPRDVIAYVKRITAATPPTDQAVAGVLRVLRHLEASRADVSSDGPYAALHELAWLPEEGVSSWQLPRDLFLVHRRALFSTSGRFLALPRREQDALRSVLGTDGLNVRQDPTVVLVLKHLMTVLERGEPVEAGIIGWLDTRSADAAIHALSDVAWVATTTGGLARPDEVFLQPHDLSPPLATIAPGWRRYERLLTAVGVRPEPGPADAIRVLRGHAQTHRDEVVPQHVRRVIRSCWALLARHDAVVGELEGESVALGSDNRLYASAQLVIEDIAGTAERFDEGVRGRFIRQPDGVSALKRAGVRELTQCLRQRVVSTGPRRDAPHVIERIRDRQPQLARIVASEGRDWQVVVDFVARLRVETFEAVCVEQYLAGFDDIAPTAQREVALYSDGHGELQVAVPGGRVDWFEIAYELQQILCPQASRSVTALITEVLSLGQPDKAHEHLTRLRYPALDDAQWEEFNLAREETREAIAEAEAAARAAAAYEEPEPAPEPEPEPAPEPEPEPAPEPEPEPAPEPEPKAAPEPEPKLEHEPAPQPKPEPTRKPGPEPQPAPSPGASGGSQGGSRTRGGGGGRRGGHVGSRERDRGAREGHGSSGPPNGGRPSERRSGGQLVSYVEPKPKDPKDQTAEQLRRDATGDAGVDLVVRDLNRIHGDRRHVRKMPDRQEGYDVRVENADGKVHQYLEVKAKTGFWDLRGVWLSAPQFRTALDEGSRFTLAVVECVYEPEATIHFIDDPASHVNRFCFDYGWAAAAQRTVNVLGAPPRNAAVAPTSNGSDPVGRLTEAVLEAGLPEPETDWTLEDGTELEAAWIDVRVGIAAAAVPAHAILLGWLIRLASEWTVEGLIDAVRDGH